MSNINVDDSHPDECSVLDEELLLKLLFSVMEHGKKGV